MKGKTRLSFGSLSQDSGNGSLGFKNEKRDKLDEGEDGRTSPLGQKIDSGQSLFTLVFRGGG